MTTPKTKEEILKHLKELALITQATSQLIPEEQRAWWLGYANAVQDLLFYVEG